MSNLYCNSLLTLFLVNTYQTLLHGEKAFKNASQEIDAAVKDYERAVSDLSLAIEAVTYKHLVDKDEGTHGVSAF